MPDFPIIDTHVHLWDPQHFAMPWLRGDALLERRYDVEAYAAQTQGVAIEAAVYIEVGVAEPYALLEPTWVVEQAQQDPRLQGIVAHAPLEYGEQVRAYLDALVKIDPRVKGVRRNLQGESDPQFCLQPAFVRGVQLLAEYGLSFDICIVSHQLPSIVQLVQQCPATAFILDHSGKPDIKEHGLDPWRGQIQELAAYPNVYCKISGLVTEADHAHWSPEDLAPYINHVLAAFGEERVVFGSDWPVALLASDYVRWVETLDTVTTHLTPSAKRKLWAENARRFYRLPPSA
ncbi:MAG TPA: amidohydrolase family protein [Ktedonobacteraceae bacterium]|nr:amidohydrolase family protein [Ktedonobacteraceae bacterium]